MGQRNKEKTSEEKSVELFLERLLEIALMQIEQESLADTEAETIP